MKIATSFLERGIFLLFAAAAAASVLHAGTVEGRPRSLKWRTASINISISESLTAANPNIKYGSDVSGAVRRSISAWENAAAVKFRTSSSTETSVSPAGRSGDGISLITIAQTPQNVLMFKSGLEDAAAKTRVFYGKSGLITEADIVLNPFLQFSTDGTPGTLDLESTLIHEIGHLLGLEHSPVRGAAMFENYALNGDGSENGPVSRAITEADAAAVRAIYGPSGDTFECCGRIEGSVGGGSKRTFVWSENVVTGAFEAGAFADAAGNFSIGGVKPGRYQIFADDTSPLRSGSQRIGTFDVANGKTARVPRNTLMQSPAADPQLIGLNGRLSSLSITVTAGSSHTILLGGTGLDVEKWSVGSNSDMIRVDARTARMVDLGNGNTAIGVRIFISAGTPAGEYSLYVENKDGRREWIVGGLSVKDVPKNTPAMPAIVE
jgi:hypothetical protein